MVELQKQTLPTAKPRLKPQGGAGTNIRSGFIDDLDQNTDLHNDKWYGTPHEIGVGDKMIRDAHVRKSLEYITGPLRAAHWGFEPASNSELDREIAAFCEYVFFENINWDQALRNILKYKVAGFSLLEQTDAPRNIPVEKFPNHPGGNQGIVITGLHHRPAWTVYRWHQSKTNPLMIDGITQHIIGSDGEQSGFRRIDADRLIRFTENQDGANFEGMATLRSAYGPWKIKIALQVIESIKHERQGIGTPTIRLPENAIDEDIDVAQTILSEMRAHQKGYLILPHGYEFTWESTSQGDNTAISESIERANRDISVNVGAGFMMLGMTSKMGSYALATSQQGQFEIGLESDAKFITTTMNSGSDGWSPVERIVRMNYGDAVQVPKMVARNLPTRDWSKILPVINQLAITGVIQPDDELEAFTRRVLRIPEMHTETTRRWRRGIESAFASLDAVTMEDEGLDAEQAIE
tara:strand:- start:247 stop:1641 length:1395 start_codon:yes stop_codon:yes gene_type:complete